MILLINGPSGSGKTTLGDYLETKGLSRIITSTTRDMREGEIDGVSYHFLSKEEFLSKERIEESTYAGNHYGVTKEEVDKKLKEGKVIFAVLDINGVRAFKEKYKDEVKVIYINTSTNKVKSRMKKRGDSVENIIKRVRFRKDTGEENNIVLADYVINNNFDTSYLKRKADIILEKLGIDINK